MPQGQTRFPLPPWWLSRSTDTTGGLSGTCPPCHTRQDTPCERGKNIRVSAWHLGRAVLILQGTHSFPLSSPQAADAVFEAWTASYFPGKTLQGAFPGRLLPCLKASPVESHPGSAPTISLPASSQTPPHPLCANPKLPWDTSTEVITPNFHPTTRHSPPKSAPALSQLCCPTPLPAKHSSHPLIPLQKS